MWFLENSPGVNQLLGYVIGANMNVTTDQAITWRPGGGPDSGNFRYIVDSIRVTNASTSLTTAAGGVYSAISKGGIAIVAAAQAYSALTTAALGLDLTVAAAGKSVLTTQPYLSLTTPQGGPATADVYLFGRFIPNYTS